MSHQNVELISRAIDAFNRRDLDAYLALQDENVEAVPRAIAMEGGHSYLGHDGVRRWWTDLLEVFPDFRTEVLDTRDLGDVTFSTLRLRARGAGSDTPTDEEIWSVARWRHGKCVWWRTFDTRAEASDAAGLGE